MQLSKERYQTTHVVLPKGSSKEPIPPPVAHHSPQLYMCGRAEELVVLVGRLSLGRAEGVLCPPPPKKKKRQPEASYSFPWGQGTERAGARGTFNCLWKNRDPWKVTGLVLILKHPAHGICKVLTQKQESVLYWNNVVVSPQLEFTPK